MKTVLSIGAAMVALCGLSLALVNAGGAKRSDAVVKVKAKVDKVTQTGKAVVVVSLDILPGWHLYANPVGHEDFESGRVQVKFSGAEAAIDYPAGKVVDDAKIGKYKIYENKIDIIATVDRVPSATNPLELSVRLQSCDDKNCLPPATVKLMVP